MADAGDLVDGMDFADVEAGERARGDAGTGGDDDSVARPPSIRLTLLALAAILPRSELAALDFDETEILRDPVSCASPPRRLGSRRLLVSRRACGSIDPRGSSSVSEADDLVTVLSLQPPTSFGDGLGARPSLTNRGLGGLSDMRVARSDKRLLYRGDGGIAYSLRRLEISSSRMSPEDSEISIEVAEAADMEAAYGWSANRYWPAAPPASCWRPNRPSSRGVRGESSHPDMSAGSRPGSKRAYESKPSSKGPGEGGQAEAP